jgi:hypothetical protein
MSKDMKYERAVHYAALFSELWNASKKVVQKDLRTLTDVRIDVKTSKASHNIYRILWKSSDLEPNSKLKL